MAEITIMPSDNGPCIVRGGAKLVDAEGKQFETRKTVGLCRCGQSSNKPFCNGSHARAPLESKVRAG